jgi:glycosyltransferase involved in cell wall biosynthesis
MNYLVYLGKSGGAEQLINAILKEMPTELVPAWKVVKSPWSNFLNSDRPVDILQIETPQTFSQFFNYIKSVRNFLGQIDLRSETSTKFVFIQNSPFDIPLILWLRMRRIRLIVAIHDAKTHPGEFWPPKIITRLLCRVTDEHIVFSEYVKSELKLSSEGCVRLNIPLIDVEQLTKEEKTKKIIILHIGRMKKYKGSSILIEAFQKIQDSNLLLRIVGRGEVPQSSDPRISRRDEWLEYQDLVAEIQSANIVVFPYIEGSQSGLIPIAMSAGKLVVLSDLPGLIEQTQGYYPALKCTPGEESSLIATIKAGVELEKSGYIPTPAGHSTTEFWKYYGSASD